MDLSHSGMFHKVKDSFHTQTRGGYRQWFNPVYADPNKNTRLRPTKTNAMLLDEDNDEDEDEVAPPEADDDAEEDGTKGTSGKGKQKSGRLDKEGQNVLMTAQRAASRPPSRAASRAPSVMPQAPPRLKNVGEIQILDLHSDNPIISYKGRIFSGSWARNIGTELVFGAHDEVAERGLPYLRDLSGGVDLMAASTARILTIPADLRPKNRSDAVSLTKSSVNPSRRLGPDKYKWMRKDSGIEIPIAFDKHGRRRPQARFLENLMAIKRKRGEMDEVTTMTKDTTKDFVSRDDDPEEATSQKKRARDRRRQQRLIEERAAQPKKKRKGGNRWVTKKVVTFADEGREAGSSEDDDEDDDEDDGPSTLSAKTPASWDQAGK